MVLFPDVAALLYNDFVKEDARIALLDGVTVIISILKPGKDPN